MPKNRSTKTMSFDAIGRDLTPTEVRDAKAFAKKYGPDGNLPTRAEVHARQRRVIDEVLQQAALENSVAEDKPLTLLPLSAFQEAHQDVTWERPKPAVVVPLREGERFIVRLEESKVLRSYGPWRNDELAEQGVACCEQDAQSFAQGLLDAVLDRLSDYELEHVVAAFAAELRQRQNEASARNNPAPQ